MKIKKYKQYWTRPGTFIIDFCINFHPAGANLYGGEMGH